MPMQPRRRAETSRSLFPSLRFCIVRLLRFAVGRRSRAVLLVADLFHPIEGLAVELFHDGDIELGSFGDVPDQNQHESVNSKPIILKLVTRRRASLDLDGNDTAQLVPAIGT